MNNFEFYNPVRILFGRGQIKRLTDMLPVGEKIMFAYGGGSIKQNGVYDQITEALAGREWIEFGGIMPNPRYEFLMPAVEKVKSEGVSFLLAVGGGSVVDACKFIATAAKFEGADPWTILSKGDKVESALPIGVVMTIPATGSEMNGNAVIMRNSSKEKLAFSSPIVYPKFSILDPAISFSLPMKQVVNGVVDAFIHVIEQYLTYPVNAEVQDHYAESLMRILMKEGEIAYSLQEPDYDNRATIMWAATNALNHFLSMGVPVDWATHFLGHELTALYGLDHAVTLAIVLPGLMQVMSEKRKDKLLQYAGRVWGLSGNDSSEVIQEAILKTEQFFISLGIKVRLSDYGIGSEGIDLIEQRLTDRGVEYLGRAGDLELKYARPILELRL
ncbi:MAG: iron-containing alcohol dehydrogenase [Bacteroidales bacterium]|nr:iron-containing alcohol dehydrogenase [Bacteroidales bacterium]